MRNPFCLSVSPRWEGTCVDGDGQLVALPTYSVLRSTYSDYDRYGKRLKKKKEDPLVQQTNEPMARVAAQRIIASCLSPWMMDGYVLVQDQNPAT